MTTTPRLRWPTSLVGALALTALAGTPACALQEGPPSTRAGAAAAAQAGRYDDAARVYERLATETSDPAERAAISRALARVLVEAGRYDDAIALAGRWSADSATLRAAAVPLGDAHRLRGRAAHAERL
jgi:tetratricopeptide (TPR) repeat protein